jgi:hypothetical protein
MCNGQFSLKSGFCQRVQCSDCVTTLNAFNLKYILDCAESFETASL